MARALFCGLLIGSSASAFAEPLTVRSELELDLHSWKDDLDDEGFQLVSLATLTATNRDWRFGLTGGYAYAESDSEIPALNGSLSTPLDTVVSASWRGLRTRVGGRSLSFSFDADASLPTGTATLGGRQRNVLFDPLLGRYDRYGEGLNVAAGVFAALGLSDSFSVGAGVKHTRKGAYKPFDDFENAPKLNPGDLTSYLTRGTWARGRSRVTFGAELSDERAYEEAGIRVLDPGTAVQLSTSASLPLGRTITADVTGLYSTRQRDRRLNPLTGVFERDEDRLTGNVWALIGSVYHQLTPRVAAGVEADYVSIGAGEIDPSDFSYLPERRRWRAGLGLRQQFGRYHASVVGRYVDYRDAGSALLIPLNASGVNFTLNVGKRW